MRAGCIPTQGQEPRGNDPTLTLEDVSFKLGSRTFGPLSMRIRGGEIVGLLGPNGSGKSSLLRVIEGALKPVTGVIRTYGADITALNRSARQRGGVFVCLHDSRRLSANRSMLEVVASAVNRNPKVLVVDEPLNGLTGMLAKQAMIAVLKTCRQAGVAILLTDHNVRGALQIVDRAYLIHRGKVRFEGGPDELLDQSEA